MSKLEKFWIRFKTIPKPTVLNLGSGVTAFSKEDAMTIVEERLYKIFNDLEIIDIITVASLNDLDEKHILPNIGDPCLRGIWFPMGY